MDDLKMKVKQQVLEQLKQWLEQGEVEDLKKLSPKFQKVEVMAKDEESLEQGLDKAKEMIEESNPEDEILPVKDEEDMDMEELKKLYEKLMAE